MIKKNQNKEYERFIKRKYKNIKTIRFEDEFGGVSPKKIKAPPLALIISPEPHAHISDIYLNSQEWYELGNFIEPLSEQSFLCYKDGYYLASISCSVNCCEYVLKYEYFKKLIKEEIDKILKNLSLGDFLDKEKLNKINLIKFLKKIDYINNLRNGYFHFNPEKTSKIARKEKSKLFDVRVPYHEGFHLPVLAYNAYSIMCELINHFYGEETRKKFVKEAIKDTEEKMEIICNYVEKIFGFPDKDFEKQYLIKKIKVIKEKIRRGEL